MSFIKPFLAGSFGAAALLRGGFTLAADAGAASVLDSFGIARLSLSGELAICAIGGMFFTIYAVRHPFARGKKN